MKMVVTFEILGFWKFSRNRLAGIQSHHATHTNSEHFLGSCKEPPGGELGAAKRRVTYHLVLGFSNEGSGGSD